MDWQKSARKESSESEKFIGTYKDLISDNTLKLQIQNLYS